MSTRMQPIGAPGDMVTGVEFAKGQARQLGRKGLPRGGVIEAVDRGSACDRAGLRPGDVLTTINGRQVRDVIDYQFYTADEDRIRFGVVPHGDAGRARTVTVDRVSDDALGLSFTQPTFSPIRECNNHCPFCFIDQLPGSMRNSLYIRDDDYRYSFLFGNFVTLTNLNERDWERLAEQRLSPLYLSVHATDLDMRRTLLGSKTAPEIMGQIRRLASLGIRVHTQVVTCPGMNDGAVLERTVADLAGEFPNVLTIGVVPVGLTRTPQEILAGPDPSCSRILPSAADLPLRTFLPDEARAVVAQVRGWQRRFRKKYDCSLVYASDELYLLCDEPFPSESSYDGYPQYENGIGMVRDLIEDWKRLRRKLLRTSGRQKPTASLTVVCAEMISGVLSHLLADWSAMTGVETELAVIGNEFFGPRVRVSGLLTGQDVVANSGRYHGDCVILPSVMLDKTGSRLLDGFTPDEVSEGIAKPVHFAGYLSEVDRLAFQSGQI